MFNFSTWQMITITHIGNFITGLSKAIFANRLMRQRSEAFLAIAMLLLLLAPVAYSIGSSGNLNSNWGKIGTLSSSPSYSESLSLYLTSAETFWQAGFSGGNITLSSLSIPSSVSSFSITLTHYQVWSSQYEIFTKNGFGLLGPIEPLPDGAILAVNTTSSADALALADSLSQIFGLVFAPYTNTSSGYSFMSPLNFHTEVHVYFWKLVPSSYQGFAAQFTEQQLEANNLAFYRLSYSSGTYSISIGGLEPLLSTAFSLYNQLGITSSNFTYSKFASSSNIAVHVLGGLVSQSNFTNHYNNFSASMFASSSGASNIKVPDLNGTLDFSFPTIVATRQITPTLNPTTNQNLTVTIQVKNVSPSGSPSANNVSVNDNWLSFFPSAFKLEEGKASGNQSLPAGQSMSIVYGFTVLHTASGNYTIPPIPVSYQFTAANKTVSEQVFLNTETLTINGTGPAIEATESINSGTAQSGLPISFNITAINRGSTAAFILVSGSQTRSSLLPGQSWSFIASSQSTTLSQINSTISYSVSWQPSGANTRVQTNTISSIYSFATPGSPASSLSKAVLYFKNSNSANVTLSVLDNSGLSISNLTIRDSIPAGTLFAKSYEPNSLRFSNGLVSANVSSLTSNQTITFSYALNITNLNENYVFMPANVSSVWNNVTIAHFSQGVGLPLGVSASKAFSPSAGFQGSTVSVQVGIANEGTLPIYEVSLNTTGDSFLALSGNAGSFKNVLRSGSSMNSTLNANLTGAPGVYNSSSSAATFIFAGSNQTATSNSFRVTIFQDLQGQMSVLSSKIEEDHNIEIMIEISNPSNVTVSNVTYSMSLPNNLNLVSGVETFQISSLIANGTYKNNITLTTNLPEQYNLNGGTLKFQFNGQTLQGQAAGLSLNIVDDLTLRYGIPVLIGLAIVLATLFYVRKLTKQQKA